MTELGDFPVDGLQNVFSRLFEHGFEKVGAEARKQILQTVDRKVAKFCHGREIELYYLLYLAGFARLGYDREEQK